MWMFSHSLLFERSQLNILSQAACWLEGWQIRIEVPLLLVLNPGPNGENFTTELPRNLIDSKGASSADTKYLIKIYGKGGSKQLECNNIIN